MSAAAIMLMNRCNGMYCPSFLSHKVLLFFHTKYPCEGHTTVIIIICQKISVHDTMIHSRSPLVLSMRKPFRRLFQLPKIALFTKTLRHLKTHLSFFVIKWIKLPLDIVYKLDRLHSLIKRAILCLELAVSHLYGFVVPVRYLWSAILRFWR